MNEYSQHIISRLKQQARIGTGIKKDDLEKARDALKKQLSGIEDLEKTITLYTDLGGVIKNLAKDEAARATGLGKLIKIQQDLAKNMQDLSKDANVFAQRNSQLQKSFGLSTAAAAKLGFELDSTAAELKISRAQAEGNYKAISKLTGGFKQNVKSLQKLNQYYVVNRGLTQEAADGLLIFSANQAEVDKNGILSEQSLIKQNEQLRFQFAAIEDITGIKGAQYEIETAIGKASSATRLTFSKYPAQLGLAVMKAKALGLELSDLETVGDNLLNIESSVGEELNYQFLTGRRLVDNQGNSLTNKYRELYLSGKSEEAAQTLYDIIDKEGDTLENNLLARKQMAKVLNVEEDKVAKIVEKRKLMKNLIDQSTGKPLTIDIFKKTGKELQDYLTKNTKVTTETLDQIMAEDKSVESPDERSAKALESFEANGIKLQMGTAEGAEELITKTAKQTSEMVTKFGTLMETQFQSIMESAAKLGTKQIEREATSQEKGGVADNLQQFLLGLGGETGVLTTVFKDAVSKIPGIAKDYIQGTKIETMTVTNLNTPLAKGDDTVMINDGIRFNPRDKFRRVNDGMTVAGTNVGGLDRYASQMEKRDRNFEQNMAKIIANMASVMTQAIGRANLKINLDRTFSGTSMNPRGKYGG